MWHVGSVDDPLPVYGAEDEPPATVVSVREVFDLVWEMLVLGIVVGFLAGSGSNYLKLLIVPLAVPVWVMLRRLFAMLRRIFSA
ncbi:MAG: hypothetical protein JWN67_3171 [Actinomycetia bacterium]|nr:hypothetical protein [Actinomycetes bacterium]